MVDTVVDMAVLPFCLAALQRCADFQAKEGAKVRCRVTKSAKKKPLQRTSKSLHVSAQMVGFAVYLPAFGYRRLAAFF
jgi:hypothetical protein